MPSPTFSLSFLPDASPQTKSATDYFRDALELCTLADEAGFRFVKMTEHYLHPYGGYCPSPLSFLTAVAMRSTRIRLLTGGILAAFHSPVQIAAETAMLDAISGGRVEIGFARAYLPYEFHAFGVSMDESRDRFEQTIRAVIALWVEPSVTIETPFFSLVQARGLPRCTQSPHPPIWCAAVLSRQSFAWIGQQGFKLLVTPSLSGYKALSELIEIYREAFVIARPGGQPEVALSLPLVVAVSDAEAAIVAERHLRQYLAVWADAAKAWDSTTSTDYPAYTGLARAIEAQTPDAMLTTYAAIAGSPNRVADRIHELVEEATVDHILWQVDFGAMPGEIARRTLSLFVEQVLEQFDRGARYRSEMPGVPRITMRAPDSS